MEHQLWRLILQVLKSIHKRSKRARQDFGDDQIVLTWLWAVLHDRPVSWACCPGNWPAYERHRPRPSCSTMSRRLRTAGVRQLLEELEQRVLRPQGATSLVWAVDGKPLVISGCSKDSQAGYGRAAGGMARGYKLHLVLGSDAVVAAWRIAPMNKDERVMARRMLRTAEVQGYVLADGNYDSNKVYETCWQRGIQLLAPRRYGPHGRLGPRLQSAGRLRAIELLGTPDKPFARDLHNQREMIERYFGNLSSWGGGLQGLPCWVRTHARVHRWVQAKLILHALCRQARTTTYAN